MATAVDFASAGRPVLKWPHRRVRSREHEPALLLRALKISVALYACKCRGGRRGFYLSAIRRPDREHALPSRQARGVNDAYHKHKAKST